MFYDVIFKIYNICKKTFISCTGNAGLFFTNINYDKNIKEKYVIAWLIMIKKGESNSKLVIFIK